MKKIVWMIGLLALATSAFADEHEPNKYTEGTHYERISPPVPTSAAEGQVEVVELFWYGCPHCYALDPYLEIWLDEKPNNVTFTRIPAVLNPGWEIHARTFYTLELMGKLDELHSQLFSAIHEEGKKLDTKSSIAKYLGEHDVDSEEFIKTFDSFAVTTRIQRAKQLGKAYGASGVPTLIVNGEFRTSASIAGGNPALIEVVNQLIESASKG